MALKLLLVEDEAILAMSEQNLLEEAGFSVEHRFSGEDAIELIQTDNDISLVLMDIDLGSGIDGTEAAKIILGIRDIPIIFLTSHTEKEIVDKVKNITSYGYVIKNTGQFVLVESINMAVNLFKAHTRLKRQEIEYREIVEGIDSAILKFDKDGKIIYFSKGAEQIFGFREEEVIGKLSVETINPVTGSDGGDHAEMMKCIFKNTEDYTINENENRTKDGRKLCMRWYNKAVYDHNNNQMYTLAIGEDITETQKTFQKLERLNHIENAFSNSPLMMSITRLSDGTYIEVNENFLKQTGYTREECIGRTSVEVGVIADNIREEQFEALKENQDIVRFMLEINTKSGKTLTCNYSGIIINIDGEKQLLSMAQAIC